MELSYEEVERYLEEISSGKRIVEVNGTLLYFKYPNNYTLMKSRRVYSKAYDDAKKDGLLSVNEMRDLLLERKVLTDTDRKKLGSLKSKLEAQQILLGKTTKVKANQDRIIKIIKEIESEINSIEYKERAKLFMTAETQAEESRILFLTWSCTYDFYTDDLFWLEYKNFLDEHKVSFRQGVVSEFVSFFSGIDTSVIRCIARSNLWRIKYVTSLKTSEPLFGVPTSEYTSNMMNLAYWSHYYQNIYEMMPEDQPSDVIIEDDVALDAYLKDYYNERSKDVASRRDKKSRKGKLSAFDSEEVIVTRGNELYEDIKYDKPREAQAVKDRNLIRKKTARSKKHRIGTVPAKPHTK